MTTTTTTHETISAGSTQPTTILEHLDSHYIYLGENTEGRHHHLEEQSATVYLTDHPPERFRPTNAAIYWFHIHGDLEHAESFSLQSVREWVTYIDHVCGWTTPPLLIDATFIQGGFN
ncbi:hypothetical protein [Natronosalvus rutilus]|uniref:Uncharacterized protein n=1 Tax=Natronosalvus rutilus TaxID=2953753 RepID=A0A9E7SW93_9EURY|nr:hypothetical protein [Natronosalvus rutilus]UTF54792.1 hypothetical protein NGM29_05865 [Natronosalvus rutilus]